MATPTANLVPVYSFDPLLTFTPYMFSGEKWGSPLFGVGVTLSFSFPGATTWFDPDYPLVDGFDPWSFYLSLSGVEQVAVRDALSIMSQFANVVFVETTDTQTNVGELRFTYTDIPGNTNYAWAYTPSDFPVAGDVWFSWVNWNADGGGVGAYDFLTIMHEVGHALGLTHPFEGPSFIPDEYDNYFYSIMSYAASAFSDNTIATFYPTTPMFLDILALQTLYGRNVLHNAGNTTYVFSQGTTYFQTIDDAGGVDTIQYVGTNSSIINLNEFEFSSVSELIEFVGGTSRATVAIGPFTVIENATGGSGNDFIIGNAASNVLNGGAGNDTLDGGNGNDTYVVNSTGDVTTETSALGGIDTVQSAVTRTLGANLERLTLTGAGVINGTGNSLANTLIGNSAANVLNGLGGADTMTGGNGNDTYIVDSTGDVTTETSALGGTDLVRSSVTRTLGANLENLILTGAGPINGTGNTLANSLIGNSGANSLNGLGGADTLQGAGGNDTLNGGLGIDTLNGGGGADTFVFNAALIAANRDAITDFSAPSDTIRLENAVFTGLALGALAASRFFIGAAAHDTSDRIIYDSANGRLYFDADGSGAIAKIWFTTLDAGLLLTAADFVVI